MIIVICNNRKPCNQKKNRKPNPLAISHPLPHPHPFHLLYVPHSHCHPSLGRYHKLQLTLPYNPPLILSSHLHLLVALSR